MTFLLRRNGQIQTQRTGDRNSLEAQAVQDKWSLQFAFASTRTTLLFIHVPALGRSRALRLSQTNLFCPPLQSSEGPWVHCTAGKSPWSRQGESEEGSAGSTGLAWLFVVGGGDNAAAQRVCATPAAQPETAEGLRAFLSSFLCSFTLPVFHLTLFLCSWVAQSGQNVFRSFPHIIFVCLQSGFYSTEGKVSFQLQSWESPVGAFSPLSHFSYSVIWINSPYTGS